MSLCPYLEVGKIVRAHGIKGEVKVLPLTDSAERYKKLKWVFIEQNGSLKKYEIESVKFFKDTAIVKFFGIEDIDAAEKLRGALLKVDRANAVKLPKDSYFVCDLIGCIVFDINGEKVGVLKDVFNTHSNDVYVVESDAGQEFLLPALKSVVKEIDIDARKIVVSMREGMPDDEV